LLAVADVEPDALQLEQHRRLDEIDADRLIGDAGLLEDRLDLLRDPGEGLLCRFRRHALDLGSLGEIAQPFGNSTSQNRVSGLVSTKALARPQDRIS